MNINELLWAIGEDALNEQTRPHDNARASYMLHDVIVRDWQEFEHCLVDYYRHHCHVVGGGDMGNSSQNLAMAKELAVQAAGRNSNIKALFRDAQSGSNGGMRGILDNMAMGIRQQYIERYIADTFDRYISPCSIDETVEIMRQFLSAYQHILPSHIEINRAEYYANNYKEYIQLFANSLARIASDYRGL